MSRLGQIGHRLYTGETSFDFIGRRKLWFGISVAILVISVLAVAFRGLNFGIEFSGGAEFRVADANCSVEEARETTAGLVEAEPIVQELGNGDMRVQTEALEGSQPEAVREALAETCGVPTEDISVQLIGPSWGGEVTRKAITGLIVFLVFVTALMWIAFDRKAAVAGLVALGHDILITVGIYALVGFDVTPSTMIGLLTILGYSLYDTVVVFDSVRENTKGLESQANRTYSEAANLSINQTLVRSINTSVIALLPVASILFFGAFVLGGGTLKDLALVLFVGIAASTYSSIFVATPLLAYLKEREPTMKGLARRVELKRAGAAKATRASGAAATSTGGTAVAVAERDDHESTDAVDATHTDEHPASSEPIESGERHQPQRQTRSQRKGGGNRGPGRG